MVLFRADRIKFGLNLKCNKNLSSNNTMNKKTWLNRE